MSEFRVHHEVNQLLSLLKVNGDGAEVYIDLLLKNRTPYVTTSVSTHSAKVKISEFSSTPHQFLKKYEELKSHNVRHLDSLVYLLSKLTEDKQTRRYLRQNQAERAALDTPVTTQLSAVTLPPSTTKMSPKELAELRRQLGNIAVTSNTAEQQVIRKKLRDKHNKHNPGHTTPQLPSWVYERLDLIGDFAPYVGIPSEPSVQVGTLPLALQEQTVVEDFLWLMVGVDGRYLMSQLLTGPMAARSFSIDPSLDVSINELLGRMLPLVSAYSIITRFIEEQSSFEYGQVNHALVAAVRTLHKEYLVLVSQLENLNRHGGLSLQKFWFYVQPTLRTVELLSSIAMSVYKGACTGGATLSLLHEKAFNTTGDAHAQELCLYLTKAASVPYFEILEKWIYKGIIQDPYSEFMVEEQDLLKERIQEDYNDKYWDQRYTVVQHCIPTFLQNLADKILSTGKYLNVVQECGQDVSFPAASEVVYTLKERAYVEQIEAAYSYASHVLLTFMLEEKELLTRLRCIKQYFLLATGDFFVNFMELAEEELKQCVTDILPLRLEALLELALRMSTANTDPYKDDLKIELMPHDLITQLLRVLAIETQQEKSLAATDPTDFMLSGIEAFSFDYTVTWPLSLIISRKSLTRYQIIFRHLFYCKYVERQLCNLWLINKAIKVDFMNSSKWIRVAFALRQRMLNFMQNIQYYMMCEVIEPNWHLFENNLKTVSNIDDVLFCHTNFLDICLKDCMLTNPELLKIFSKLMSVCVMFTNCMQRFSNFDVSTGAILNPQGIDIKSEDGEHFEEWEKDCLMTKYLAEYAQSFQNSESFETTIDMFDNNFSTYLLDLLDKISIHSTNDCEHSMINIIYRLDFSGYYAEKLEQLAMDRSQKKRVEKQSSGTSAGAGRLV
uniref:gamma-tubulin complex component 2 isoform X2 n=1 Tax=Myxine glutinosa TaxID=7769 RepID=UPI00358F45C9